MPRCECKSAVDNWIQNSGNYEWLRNYFYKFYRII